MDLTQFLCAFAEQMKCSFTLRGQSMPADKAFAPKALLPALLKKADHLCDFCMGHGIHVMFPEEQSSMVSYTFELKPEASKPMILLCLVDVMMDMIYAASSRDAIALDELLEQ